ncbi:dimethylargininase [Kribbella solani]|uniref:N-dimethylarginine dimethylaminohydrolase n=1 Tax=Kribbella solani TaxID=236067 RepID=A0A841DSL1_9ACTN|nr:dimethylargininase [Kribbella solani]MBB5980901.1 N-dimethylarginine dimethylaminohydrolase [Kribbella solani]
MTTTATAAARVATKRHLLMCPPEHFTVRYEINPWMNVDVAVDHGLANRQWERLRQIYEELGHRVDVMAALPGLPDMVFTANAGVVHNGRALVSNFTHPERQPESEGFLGWFREAGFRPASIAATRNEGEGDVLTVGRLMLAGVGPRTARASHQELREFFDVPVITLELVDPRFYHLDTAMSVLDERTVAYYPGAFSQAAVAVIEQLFPGAIRATEEDACGFGLNAMSDGRNVVMSDRAPGLTKQLEAAGFHPITTDMSELLKSGGSVKCCTLELRS